jgi:hypothetical protein
MTKKESDAQYYQGHKEQIIARSTRWNANNATRRCTARRKAAGLCTRCGKVPPSVGKVRCLQCNTPHVAASKERYRRHLNSGECPCCVEHRPLVKGRRACAKCLLERQIHELRKAGLSESELARAKHAAETFNGFCQACGRKDSCGYWCLDHDHIRLTFRGVIGQYCNLALGNVKDDGYVLRRLAIYLERDTRCLADS